MQTIYRAPAARTALTLLVACGLTACATATKNDPSDPWEGWNRGAQQFNDTLDDYVVKPVAHAYQWVTPTFVDRGITNFFSNVDDIGVIVNDFLQWKLAQSGQDTGRFLINTAVGLGGFVDVATHLNLPKHREDLDQTLAVWGVPPGPYLVLPFVGPGTPRHITGRAGDAATNPLNYISPIAVPWLTGALDAADKRADFLKASKIADQAAPDRYEFIRNAYFQQREYEIHDGNPPFEEDLEADMEPEAEGTGVAATVNPL